MTITFRSTKRGMSIRASGKDANALFEAMTSKKPMAKVLNPLAQVAAFNNQWHVGQDVDYRSDPFAEPQRFKTRCHAEVLSGHTANGSFGRFTLKGVYTCACEEVRIGQPNHNGSDLRELVDGSGQA